MRAAFFTAALAFSCSFALAQETPFKTKPSFSAKPFADDEPLMLTAGQMDYDQVRKVIVASGKVEIVQGDSILIADRLTYDQANNTVIAEGHVSLLEESGTVFFAERMALKNNLERGVIDHFKARLNDNSVLAANRAVKTGPKTMEMRRAAYSPCHCDDEDSWFDAPQWQIKADRVVLDQEAQKIYYNHARIEAYGVPVLYTPYLSHSAPGAENQSGLLAPEWKRSANLGSVWKIPVYYSIAPDRDLTLIPISTSREGLVMAGEYRQLFDEGNMRLDGSITRPRERDARGNPTSGSELRGHLNATGRFTLPEETGWGFDIHRTTDDTYLRRYRFGDDTLLTSKVYIEKFNFGDGNDRNYGNIEALAFQGLTAQTDADRVPLVLPLAGISLQSDPGRWNSRFSFDGSMMSLYRDLGPESRRLSTAAAWKLPYITEGGQMIEFSAELRGDVYSVSDVPLGNGRSFTGTTGRLVPQASLNWRYPLIRQWGDSSLIVEPIAAMTLSPYGSNPDEIPNEDSLVPEFTDTNLFSSDRYPGLDRVESGPRASYGLRAQARLFSDKYIDGLFGQHYRLDDDAGFPYSNNLTSHFSDYVGKLGLNYSPLYLAYRFRLDKETFSPQRSEVEARFSQERVHASLSYLALENDPILANKEYLSGSVGLRLARDWTWNGYATQDLELGQITGTGMRLTYLNECTSIVTQVHRSYTNDRDIKPTTDILIRLFLKNLD